MLYHPGRCIVLDHVNLYIKGYMPGFYINNFIFECYFDPSAARMPFGLVFNKATDFPEFEPWMFSCSKRF